MARKPRVLFVCTANQQRSPTAEAMYRDDIRIEVASAGTSSFAVTPIDEDRLTWADSIVVMEEQHRKNIIRRFPEIVDNKKIYVLNIPDMYPFKDFALMREIKNTFEPLLRNEIL